MSQTFQQAVSQNLYPYFHFYNDVYEYSDKIKTSLVEGLAISWEALTANDKDFKELQSKYETHLHNSAYHYALTMTQNEEPLTDYELFTKAVVIEWASS